MQSERLAVVLLAFVVSLSATHGALANAPRGFAIGAEVAVALPWTPAFRATTTATVRDPATVEASLNLDLPKRRLIQQGLRNEGFDPGAPDGLFGPLTRGAIRRWQEARGVPATGYLDGAEADLLRAAGAPPPQRSETTETAPAVVLQTSEAAGDPVTDATRQSLTEPAERVAQPVVERLPVVPAQGVNCEDWNTAEFFERATASVVAGCLALGASVDARSEYLRLADLTPLHFAAMDNENPAVIDALLAAGADLEARESRGMTPLSLAVFFGDSPAAFDTLLAAGADPRAVDDLGMTPLHFASRSVVTQHGEHMVPALLAAGADPRAESNNTGNWPAGLTPLHFAAYIDPAGEAGTSLAIVEALLAAGADPRAQSASSPPAPGVHITPLHTAAATGHLAVVEVLLAAGADPTARHPDGGGTPLHYGGEAASVLVAAGADVEARNYAGRTPLHTASNAEEIEALAAAGANVEARDERGRTPLHLAGPEKVAALVAAGANVDARDERGWTPLHHEVIRRFTHSEEFPELTSRALADSRARIEALIAAGANIEARDERGNTPLHLAARPTSDSWRSLPGTLPHYGHAIEELLDGGANPSARNAAGRTPWDLAQANEALRGSDGYWRLNDARFNDPRQKSRRPANTLPGNRLAVASEQIQRQGPGCEIPGYPSPANVQGLGLNWCSEILR